MRAILKHTILFVFFSMPCLAQSTSFDANVVKKITSDTSVLKTQAPFVSPFRFYKKYISSQDIPNVCRFHPSCSGFGQSAVHKKGIFIGLIATFDRLTRCNGRQSSAYYYFDEEKNRFLDPVE